MSGKLAQKGAKRLIWACEPRYRTDFESPSQELRQLRRGRA